MIQQDIADAYFAAMRAQDLDGLLGLFVPEAEIVWPDGRVIAGHAAVRVAYAGMWQHPSNNPQPGPLMVGPGCFSCEVHSHLADGSERRTVNVFTLGDGGLLSRMASYRSG